MKLIFFAPLFTSSLASQIAAGRMLSSMPSLSFILQGVDGSLSNFSSSAACSRFFLATSVEDIAVQACML